MMRYACVYSSFMYQAMHVCMQQSTHARKQAQPRQGRVLGQRACNKRVILHACHLGLVSRKLHKLHTLQLELEQERPSVLNT